MRKILFLSLILFFVHSTHAQLTSEQHDRLIKTTRWLSKKNLRYTEEWKPPGQKSAWVMDCSNTSRYIYLAAFGKGIPRTASDQFVYLQQRKQVWAAPQREDGSVDSEKLFKYLRSGDLLFWEWTYNIKRRPPITHVMVYLGQTKDGIPKMAGSSSRSRGENRSRGGVDIYPFDPNANYGGVKSFFGNYKKRARFVAFGRPIMKQTKASSSSQASDSYSNSRTSSTDHTVPSQTSTLRPENDSTHRDSPRDL